MEKVFIIEDSKVQVNRLKRLLESDGYKVVGWARTGQEAIEQVEQLKPDVIFIDIILEGGMDGIQAAEKIQEKYDIPIIFTTNYSNSEYVDRALKVSPYAYMLKPIDEDQLRVTLETVKHRVALESEKLKLTTELHQSQKMEAIGRLAGGIAHNFNNILSVIIGSAETALKGMKPDDPNNARLTRIVKSGMSARELTTKMLALTRREKGDYQAIPVRSVIEDVCDVLKESISRNIEMQTDISADAGKIRGDVNEVMQALLNVCINACDSMEDGGTLTLRAHNMNLESGADVISSDLAPGKYCCITVEDTGCGITEDVRKRIFEPFFTTKEKEKGTGLGMYVTLGIIRAHGGHIDVSANCGRGTMVEMYFPACPGEEAECREQKPEAVETANNSETILIVDDEPDFVDTMSEMLEIEGYKILAVRDGAGAVRLYRDLHQKIDLVLLDLMMPGMEGDEVYHRLREIEPDARIVLCSGFSVEGKVGSLMKQGARAFIQKPFEFRELKNTIAQVLSM